MRILLVAATILALVGAALAARVGAVAHEQPHARSSAPPVLGISYRSPAGTLAWFDPLTLQMLRGRKTPLTGQLGSWAFSENRAVLAIAQCNQIPRIRFINARAMRVLGDLRLSPYVGCASALTWLRPDRALAFVHTTGGSELVVVDPVARRVLRREPLGDRMAGAIVRTENELVILSPAVDEIGPAELIVVDTEGRARVVAVTRVQAGTISGDDGSHRRRTVIPGITVDPVGRRAFLVPAAGPVAEIDLVSLEVSYHELERPTILQRLLRWLTPAAAAKVVEGPVRTARWLENGVIAVSGQDYAVGKDGNGQERMTTTPAGLTLIDTRLWTSRKVDDSASGFALGPEVVVAQGGHWDSVRARRSGPGLRAFSYDGRERWRLHAGEYRWMDAVGKVGYAYVEETAKALVVDLATGAIIGTVRWDDRNPLPQLLADKASSW